MITMTNENRVCARIPASVRDSLRLAILGRSRGIERLEVGTTDSVLMIYFDDWVVRSKNS